MEQHALLTLIAKRLHIFIVIQHQVFVPVILVSHGIVPRVHVNAYHQKLQQEQELLLLAVRKIVIGNCNNSFDY